MLFFIHWSLESHNEHPLRRNISIYSGKLIYHRSYIIWAGATLFYPCRKRSVLLRGDKIRSFIPKSNQNFKVSFFYKIKDFPLFEWNFSFINLWWKSENACFSLIWSFIFYRQSNLVNFIWYLKFIFEFIPI